MDFIVSTTGLKDQELFGTLEIRHAATVQIPASTTSTHPLFPSSCPFRIVCIRVQWGHPDLSECAPRVGCRLGGCWETGGG